MGWGVGVSDFFFPKNQNQKKFFLVWEGGRGGRGVGDWGVGVDGRTDEQAQIVSTDGQADGRKEGRTDGQTNPLL